MSWWLDLGVPTSRLLSFSDLGSDPENCCWGISRDRRFQYFDTQIPGI